MPNLSEQQKKQYNTYRAEGMSPERALALSTKDTDNQYNPALEYGVDNVLFGKGSLTEAVGEGVKEAATGGFREVYKDTQKYGAGFALAKAPLTLLAGAGRGFGTVIGGTLETFDDMTGEVISGAVAPTLSKAVESDIGQSLIQSGIELDEAGRGIPSDILESLDLFGLSAIAKSGAAASIKQTIKQSTDDFITTGVKKTGEVKTSLSDFFGRKKDAPVAAKEVVEVAAETAEDKALKAAAELLQSGSKKAATGRAAKYNNADIQAMKAIRDSDAPLASQQELADFFGGLVDSSVKERDALLKPFLSNSVDDTYLNVIKTQIKELRVAGDLDEATKYAQFLKKESDFFDKIGKAAPGGKNTVEQLSERIKEINKKVSKLYDDAGGKENLLPDQKVEAQAYDLMRQGLKTELDEIGGAAYKEAGLKTSGLLDAQTFSRIQRDRAKNALTGTPWEKMTTAQRAVFVKDFFPTIKDFGISKLVKLDTKADILDALVAEKVRLIREFGKDALNI